MIAVILAAGRGTRMGALTANTPKPLLALQGRPILEHILLNFRAAGVTDFVLVTGYLGEQIEAYFGNGDRLGLRIHYRRQEHANGTAGALLMVRDLIAAEPFAMSWGDVLIEPHAYAAILGKFAPGTTDAVLSVNHVDDPWRGGAVYVDETDRITRIIEKPPRGTSTTHWNNAGVFVLAPRAWSYIDRIEPSERNELELPQALGTMVADRCHVVAHRLSGFWSDLGTPEDLAAAQSAYPGLPANVRP